MDTALMVQSTADRVTVAGFREACSDSKSLKVR